MNCNNTTVQVQDFFSIDRHCVGKGLKYSVFGGIGAIGLLLLVVLVLIITICCLASKLWKIKRKTRVAFFANSDLAQEITDAESNSNTLNALVVDRAEDQTLKQENSVSNGGSEPQEAPAASKHVTNEIDDEYATVQQKGAQLHVSSDHSDEETDTAAKKVGRKVSVSYDYIGEDSYLMTSSGKAHSRENEETKADDDAKYSKIASSVGVRILEDDHGELRHLTDTPLSVGGLADALPPSSDTAEDISLLYSKINKQKKASENGASQGKEKPNKDSEVSPSSLDHKSPSTMPAEGGSAVGEICDRSSAEEPRVTVESLASIEMIVSDMYNSLKTAEEGVRAGDTRGRGTVMEEATPGGDGEKMSCDVAKAESGCQDETQEPEADDDSFYVNIDL